MSERAREPIDTLREAAAEHRRGRAVDEFVDEGRLRPWREVGLRPGGQCSAIGLHTLDDDRVYVYKRYPDEILAADPTERLLRLLRWRHALPALDRATLDRRTAWVRHLVLRDGALTGVLVPPAPDAFWTPDADHRPRPHTLEALTLPDDTFHRDRGLAYFSARQSVARLGHLLETLDFLHRHRVVAGDLQMSNVLVSRLTGRPATLLVDCDSALLDGSWTLPPAELALMRPEPPAPWPDVLDRRTDLYKFALLATWAIGKDMSLLGPDRSIADALPAGHTRLLRRLLDEHEQDPPPVDLPAVAHVWRHHVVGDPAGTPHRPGRPHPPVPFATPSRLPARGDVVVAVPADRRPLDLRPRHARPTPAVPSPAFEPPTSAASTAATASRRSRDPGWWTR